MKYNIIGYGIQNPPYMEGDNVVFYVQIDIVPEGITVTQSTDVNGNIYYAVPFTQKDFTLIKIPNTFTALQIETELKNRVINYVTTNYGLLTLDSIVQ